MHRRLSGGGGISSTLADRWVKVGTYDGFDDCGFGGIIRGGGDVLWFSPGCGL